MFLVYIYVFAPEFFISCVRPSYMFLAPTSKYVNTGTYRPLKSDKGQASLLSKLPSLPLVIKQFRN